MTKRKSLITLITLTIGNDYCNIRGSSRLKLLVILDMFISVQEFKVNNETPGIPKIHVLDHTWTVTTKPDYKIKATLKGKS